MKIYEKGVSRGGGGVTLKNAGEKSVWGGIEIFFIFPGGTDPG